jgi:hypothetical protein
MQTLPYVQPITTIGPASQMWSIKQVLYSVLFCCIFPFVDKYLLPLALPMCDHREATRS